jgi:hypothetical protein
LLFSDKINYLKGSKNRVKETVDNPKITTQIPPEDKNTIKKEKISKKPEEN